jgi:hypothetical protein
MHDRPERQEREADQSDQDPSPTRESDAERVTGEQVAELEDESDSASSDPQRQDG